MPQSLRRNHFHVQASGTQTTSIISLGTLQAPCTINYHCMHLPGEPHCHTCVQLRNFICNLQACHVKEVRM